MYKEIKKQQKVSGILTTYNGDRTLDECLNNFFAQDYPKDKMELIIADGGSTDKTLDIIKKYIKKYPKIIKFFHNEKKYKIGKGMGMDTASRKATGEILLLFDQDNILIQKNWLSSMVSILNSNKEISGVQSRMAVPKKGPLVDKYLSAIGIEDPFAIPYSLNSQIVFNPDKFKYDKKIESYIYTFSKDNFYYCGDNGFIIWKSILLENGGYTQDIDNAYRMALSKKKYSVAVPKNLKIHHKTSTELKHFLKKRVFYIKNYIHINKKGRDFEWFSPNNSFSQNSKFILSILYNLSFFPAFFQSIHYALKEKRPFWLIHSFMLEVITLSYIFSFILAKFTKSIAEAKV